MKRVKIFGSADGSTWIFSRPKLVGYVDQKESARKKWEKLMPESSGAVHWLNYRKTCFHDRGVFFREKIDENHPLKLPLYLMECFDIEFKIKN